MNKNYHLQEAYYYSENSYLPTYYLSLEKCNFDIRKRLVGRWNNNIYYCRMPWEESMFIHRLTINEIYYTLLNGNVKTTYLLKSNPDIVINNGYIYNLATNSYLLISGLVIIDNTIQTKEHIFIDQNLFDNINKNMASQIRDYINTKIEQNAEIIYVSDSSEIEKNFFNKIKFEFTNNVEMNYIRQKIIDKLNN